MNICMQLRGILFGLIFTISLSSNGQSPQDIKQLRAYEDTLAILSDSIVNGRYEYIRVSACHQFIPVFIKALKTPGSFQYSFDSLEEISILISPDQKFRIFTWQILRFDGSYRFYGAIQMNTKEMEVYPLFDNSRFMENIEDSILDARNWYGCRYYNIIKLKQKKYTLFGWDGNNLKSNRKIIEILHFDDSGSPLFGAALFDFGDYITHRHIIEYKKGAGVGLNYDTERKKIIFDHLMPEHDQANLKHTYIPDGSYEGFEYKRKRWMYIDKIFDIILLDSPPGPNMD